MQRYSPQSVGDVLRDLLEESSLQNRMDELRAAEMWSTITGPAIASNSGRPVVKNGLMTVAVPNASLRNELHMNRTRLRELINNKIGKNIITEIKFTS